VATGRDYTVRDPVVADGYMYQFKVKSPYGVFGVTGIGALRKLEHEIWAIGQLKQVTKSEASSSHSRIRRASRWSSPRTSS
jgi:hypothetical protein